MRFMRPVWIGLLAVVLIVAASGICLAAESGRSKAATERMQDEISAKKQQEGAHDSAVSMRRTALRLAVEENMQVHKCIHTCKEKESFLTKTDLSASSVVILVPLNKEILDAAVDYRAVLEKMSESDTDALRQRQFAKYLDGDTCAFVLMVKNDATHPGRCSFRFEMFESGTILHDEQHSYNLAAYTRIFDSPLSLGWNNGYLYFPNYRECGSNSCSVHFTGYQVQAGTACEAGQPAAQEWAFGFDESEIKFLSLLSNNIPEDHIRAEYIAPLHPSLDLDVDDVLQVVGVIVGLVNLMPY